MNFLDMCRGVRQRVGVQGTGPSTVGTTDFDSIFVTHVSDSWDDIQMSKKRWKWMKVTAFKSFLTVADTTSYTLTDIFGPTHRMGRWDTKSIFINDGTQRSGLNFVNYDTYIRRHLNDVSASSFSEYTVDPSNNSIIIPLCDTVYTIEAYYYKSKQTLTLDADVPELPLDFHNVIIYQAVARYAASVSMSQIYQEYEAKYSKLYDDLVRDQLPKERIAIKGIA